MQDKIEPVMEVAKAAPSVSIIGLTLLGIPLDQWVLIGSGSLIALQIFFLLREKVYLPWRTKHDKQGQ